MIFVNISARRGGEGENWSSVFRCGTRWDVSNKVRHAGIISLSNHSTNCALNFQISILEKPRLELVSSICLYIFSEFFMRWNMCLNIIISLVELKYNYLDFYGRRVVEDQKNS